jgi:sugar phosphate isomerase/epimerase
MNNLGIEFISVFGMPPVQLVELASDLGYNYISGGLQSMPGRYNPDGYPQYSLKNDLAMRRDLISAMKDRGVSMSLGEGFAIFPNSDVRESYAGDLDVMNELGVKRINSVSFETDLNRSFDQLGALAEMAGARGMVTMIEFVPTFGIADLPTALDAVRHVSRRDFKILIDTMHTGRSGARAQDIAALDAEIIGYVQLCDAPLKPKIPDYLEEAMYERMIPGTGEMPLRDILAALPRDRVIGLEVPLRSLADAGIGPRERMARCLDATRKLLSELYS